MTMDALPQDGTSLFADEDVDLTTDTHEVVRLRHDRRTGLKAIIAVHDTRLGPALGGTRFYPYDSETSALRDVLRLSKGMTNKAAAAGLDLGGGKAVILGDPAEASPELFEAYGRFVDSFGGSYIAAGDVGVSAGDLDAVGRTTPHVVGRTERMGGSGDSGFSTALGVFKSMEAGARAVYGEATVAGLSVGVEGAGKVGRQLIELLHGAGASVVFAEQNVGARDRVLQRSYPGVEHRASVIDAEVDVYAPCAMGATLTVDAPVRARLVCGAANNQLLDDSVEAGLAAKGILWVPDFVANAGGLIQLDAERTSASKERVADRLARLSAFVEALVARAADNGVTPGQAARLLVEERLAAV